MSYSQPQMETRAVVEAIGLMKDTFLPVTVDGDCEDPHVSKFGGKIPSIPWKEKWYSVYEKGYYSPDHMAFQFYIPSLPYQVQLLFPREKRKGTITATISDPDGICWTIFEESELDEVEYEDDPPGENDYYYNNPKLILKWEKVSQPPTTRSIFASIFVSGGYAEWNKYDRMARDMWNVDNTHLLGYPFYLQGDDQSPSAKYKPHMFIEMTRCEATSFMIGDSGEVHLWPNRDFSSIHTTSDWT